jgi:hypothetical protein
MISIITGHSEDPDSAEALAEILTQCSEQLGEQKPKAGIFLAALDFEYQDILNGIMEKWPDLELIGCSTDGEVSTQLGFTEDSVLLTLFASDTVDIKAGLGKNLSQDNQQACKDAVTMASKKSSLPPSLCLTCPEGLTTADASETVVALKSALGEGVTLIGASSADQWNFKETFQFFGNQVVHDALPILVFSGDLQHSYGISSGWKPVGKAGVVTKSEGSLVSQIDEAPAIEYYRNLLGQDAKPRGDRPIAVLDDHGDIKCLRASAEDYDQNTGAVQYFGSIPVGSRVQLTVADNTAILDSASSAIKDAIKRFPEGKTPQGALLFSCSARRVLLGTRINEEQTVMFSEFKQPIPFAGFYGYGEICNLDFHNETCIVVLLG